MRDDLQAWHNELHDGRPRLQHDERAGRDDLRNQHGVQRQRCLQCLHGRYLWDDLQAWDDELLDGRPRLHPDERTGRHDLRKRSGLQRQRYLHSLRGWIVRDDLQARDNELLDGRPRLYPGERTERHELRKRSGLRRQRHVRPEQHHVLLWQQLRVVRGGTILRFGYLRVCTWRFRMRRVSRLELRNGEPVLGGEPAT